MDTKRTAIYAMIATLLLTAGCTLEDGAPWGYAEADMTVPEPSVGADFEVESFEIELNTVRLIETTSSTGGSGEFDPQNPPPGCDLCHGGHCHCDGELVSYEDLRAQVASGGQTSRHVVANIDPTEPITSIGTVSIGEASVGDRVAIDTVEVELAGLTVEGTLTRDGEQIPTTMSLPGIGGMKFSGPATMSFGPDAPETQTLEIALEWNDNWLDAIDVDQLETNSDQEIVIASTTNRDAAQTIVGQVAESTIQIEVHHD